MKALEVKNVTFGYEKDVNVLNSINLDANYGDITVIAGSSGQGKSTLLNIIAGYIPKVNQGYFSGDVIINGRNVSDMTLNDQLSQIGVIYQNYEEQIIHDVVEDEIAFGLENIGMPEEAMASQIDLVTKLMNLDKEDMTRTLSGGEKQRLISGSVLAMGRKIILFDEPFANLDKQSVKMMIDIMKAYAQNGYCIIVVEHRLNELVKIANKIYYLSSGTLTEPNLDEFKCPILESRFIKNKQEYPLIEMKGVEYSVKDKTILKDFDATFYEGTSTLILGDNGVGKTTLLSLVGRLRKPTSGEIEQHIDDKFKNNNRKSKKWFKKVGIVYQNPDYQLFMKTVQQEVYFGNKDHEYCDYIMDLLDLTRLKDRHPQSLSLGEKRRLTIGVVLAKKPELLLLDEPTVGQDLDTLNKVVHTLQKVHEETNNTIICITHDKRCALSIGDYAMLLEDGKVSQTGGEELIKQYFNL